MSTHETQTLVQNRLSQFSFAPEFRDNSTTPMPASMSLRGRVALISGGATGIPRAIATELAQRGAAVAVVHHGTESEAETLCDVIRSFGSRSLAIDSTLTDEPTCANMVAQVFDQLGVVDIVVHFADFRTETPIHLLHRRDWDSVVHDGLGSAYNLTRALINPMRQHGGGRLIFVVESPWRQNRCQYGQVMAGEAAIKGFARALAAENAARGITVNCVATGVLETLRTIELTSKERERIKAMIPAARLGRPEEAAHVVAFLASDQAAYVTGQMIAVDGGLSI